MPSGEGLRRAAINEKISNWILARANRSLRIAAICTGIYGLAPTGLLDGREVTTHWRFASDVRGASQSCVLIIEDHSSRMVRFIRPRV